jgi:hypothetical protein
MREIVLKHRNAVLAGLAIVGFALLVLIGAEIFYGQHEGGFSAAQPAAQAEKMTALEKLRASGVITAREYQAKVQALEAGAAAATAAGSTAPARGSNMAVKMGWSATRRVEVEDPVYRMTAYTLEIPDGWKYAGAIARPTGCHSNGAALKYTAQSPDGLTAMVLLPGVAWSWSSSESMQKIMESSHCPAIDIDSAASFLVNIAVPNLHPNAKVLGVFPLLPEGQAALAAQLEKERRQNVEMAKRYNAKPQKLTLEGARVRVQYERDGQPVEEMIVSVIDCNESTMPGVYKQPAYQQRSCFSRGTIITRAPLGHLDEMMALAQFQALSKTLQANPEWQSRLMHDQQAAFQKAQADNNRQFQAMMKKGRDDNDALLARGRAFQDAQKANTERFMAADRARQDAIDASAHKMALYAGDKQEFTNPATGQTIQASNQYNHQWISSDGSTLIQTNDHTYDPNGQVYPVNQSWTELVAK